MTSVGLGSSSLPHWRRDNRRTYTFGLRTAAGGTPRTPPSFTKAQQRCQRQGYVNTTSLSHMLTCGHQALSPTAMSSASRPTLAPQARHSFDFKNSQPATVPRRKCFHRALQARPAVLRPHSIRLDGGPAGLLAAHHMQVKVVHGLTAAWPVVDDHPEAVLLWVVVRQPFCIQTTQCCRNIVAAVRMLINAEACDTLQAHRQARKV